MEGEQPNEVLPRVRELRERVQAPVREANDLGGVLWGDWLSPPVTRLFLKLGLSPTVATVGMLPTGLLGCLLVALGGGYSVAGAVLLVLFYVLDCVDGEVARYRRQDKFFWSYADFFFGVWVMCFFYIALGVHAARYSGEPWLGILGAVCVVLFTTKKFVDVSHIFLTIQHIILARGEQRRRFSDEVGFDPHDEMPPPDRGDRQATTIARRDVLRRYGSPVGLFRGVIMNFHIGIVLFLLASIIDLLIPPFTAAGVPIDLKSLFLIGYFCLLSFNAADYFIDGMRGGFIRKSRELVEALQGRRT